MSVCCQKHKDGYAKASDFPKKNTEHDYGNLDHTTSLTLVVVAGETSYGSHTPMPIGGLWPQVT